MLEKDHPLAKLIEEIKKIPGIGAKSAQRIAFYLIGLPLEDAQRLADAILNAKRNVFYCSVCNGLTHVDPCYHCSKEIEGDVSLCIVEEPFNIASIEKTGIFKGRYHVLLGALSPLKGRGPDEMNTGKLVDRVKQDNYAEIIIATNPTVEGEATAHFLTQLLQEYGVRITRLAMGLPVGSDIDFADQVTIKKSLEGRTEIKTD
jgi:recombination protein RecR